MNPGCTRVTQRTPRFLLTQNMLVKIDTKAADFRYQEEFKRKLTFLEVYLMQNMTFKTSVFL